MAKSTTAERSLISRIGAYTVHARYDSHALTEPARKAFQSKFLEDVDPNHELPIEERERRAAMARKAHYTRLALRSVKARQRKAQQRERLARPADPLLRAHAEPAEDQPEP